MDFQNLPQFPSQHEDRLCQNDPGQPSRGENLCILFEFSTGLALANIVVLGLLLPFFSVNAHAVAVVQAPLVFGIFALLIAGSRISSFEQAATDAYEEGGVDTVSAYGAGMLLLAAAIVGIGLGIGLASLLSRWFGSLRSPFDHVIASGLTGALVGFIGGLGLILTGGTPDWTVGRAFTALGRIVPALLRKLFFPKRAGEIRISGKPWLEGVVWSCFVSGPIVFWLVR